MRQINNSSSIEFGNRQSNGELSVSSISEPMELIEYNRTQSTRI